MGNACNSATTAQKLLAVAWEKILLCFAIDIVIIASIAITVFVPLQPLPSYFQCITRTISVLLDAAADESNGRNGAANQGAQD